jgi:hypothetical protein
MSCDRCRENPEAICPCKAPRDPRYPNDVDYDEEANGWEYGLECMTKLVRGHFYEIWWNHHGAGYNVEGEGGESQLHVEGTYHPTTTAVAWEIDHGIGVGDRPPGRRIVAVLTNRPLDESWFGTFPVVWLEGEKVHVSGTTTRSALPSGFDLEWVRDEIELGRAVEVSAVLREPLGEDRVALVCSREFQRAIHPRDRDDPAAHVTRDWPGLLSLSQGRVIFLSVPDHAVSAQILPREDAERYVTACIVATYRTWIANGQHHGIGRILAAMSATHPLARAAAVELGKEP